MESEKGSKANLNLKNRLMHGVSGGNDEKKYVHLDFFEWLKNK
jgi:hypothetical protein